MSKKKKKKEEKILAQEIIPKVHISQKVFSLVLLSLLNYIQFPSSDYSLNNFKAKPMPPDSTLSLWAILVSPLYPEKGLLLLLEPLSWWSHNFPSCHFLFLSTAQTPPWPPSLPSFHFSSCLLRSICGAWCCTKFWRQSSSWLTQGPQRIYNLGRESINHSWQQQRMHRAPLPRPTWLNCQFLPTEPRVASGSPFQYEPSQKLLRGVRPQNELNATSQNHSTGWNEKTGKNLLEDSRKTYRRVAIWDLKKWISIERNMQIPVKEKS